MTRIAQVEIHTDGACRGNPGPGGWGAEKELSGSAPETTNNRMELTAAVEALRALNRSCDVQLFTDSVYVKQGVTEWLARWKRNGWRTANKKPVRNQDLWEALDEEAGRHRVQWHWVKGHSGNPGNERADRLANEAIDRMTEKA